MFWTELFSLKQCQLFIIIHHIYKYSITIFYICSFHSNGSIINNVGVSFASSSVPNDTQIANVLISASSNITAFNIDTSSISINGTRKQRQPELIAMQRVQRCPSNCCLFLHAEVSSAASHQISLITASLLVLMSWLLSSQH